MVFTNYRSQGRQSQDQIAPVEHAMLAELLSLRTWRALRESSHPTKVGC